MTQSQPEAFEEPTPAPVTTGNPSVDAVLASLEDLDEMPVADQVAVYEKAHEELRGALDAPAPADGGDQPSDQPHGV